MILLLAGLIVFLGVHSIQIFASKPREAFIARLGAGPWKGLYSLVSAIGLVLIVIGYGQARVAAPLWPRPPGALMATAALVLIGFILITAAYWPRNHIKAAVRDPMVLGVGAWALGHLLVKSTPAALALFGAFLLWSILDFISLRARGADGAPARASWLNTIGVVALGSLLFAVFAFYAHAVVIGVRPFG